MSFKFEITREYKRLLQRDRDNTDRLLVYYNDCQYEISLDYYQYLERLSFHYRRLSQLVVSLEPTDSTTLDTRGYAHDISAHLYHNGCVVWEKAQQSEVDPELTRNHQWHRAYEGLKTLSETLSRYSRVRMPLLEEHPTPRARAYVLLCYLWRWYQYYGERWYEIMTRERPVSMADVEDLDLWMHRIGNDDQHWE